LDAPRHRHARRVDLVRRQCGQRRRTDLGRREPRLARAQRRAARQPYPRATLRALGRPNQAERAVASALLAEPRWANAAQALVDGCVDLPNDEDRVALLAAVCEGLGDDLYPAFLRVLAIVGKNGDHGARAAVANALVHALRTGRLPSGRRSA